MKKRLNLFNVSLFIVFVIFFIRQIFSLSRIASIIGNSSAIYSISFLLIAVLLGFLAIFIFYYLPILFVIEIVVLISYNFDKIPNLRVTNTIYEYKEQFLYRVNYHRLSVYRCWFHSFLIIQKNYERKIKWKKHILY